VGFLNLSLKKKSLKLRADSPHLGMEGERGQKTHNETNVLCASQIPSWTDLLLPTFSPAGTAALLLPFAAFESLRQRIVEIGKEFPVAEALEAPEIYPHNHTNYTYTEYMTK